MVMKSIESAARRCLRTYRYIIMSFLFQEKNKSEIRRLCYRGLGLGIKMSGMRLA